MNLRTFELTSLLPIVLANLLACAPQVSADSEPNSQSDAGEGAPATTLVQVTPETTELDAAGSDSTSLGPVSEVDVDASGVPTDPSASRNDASLPPVTSNNASDTDAGQPPATETVSGRVIDFWGHQLADVDVKIGTASTTTGANGEFTVAGVAPEYDVSLVVRLRGDVVEVYGWHFEGLTRRDPTLQVYKGLPLRQTQLAVTVEGMEANTRGVLALGGQHGHTYMDLTSQFDTSSVWRGPEQLQATAHALSWSSQTTNGAQLPNDYLAHQAVNVTLQDGAASSISVSLPANPTPLQSAPILGRVYSGLEGTATVSMFARFSSGPSLMLASEPRDVADSNGTSFSYLAPTVNDMSLSVAARVGTGTPLASYAIGYASGLQPGSAGVVIEVPQPAAPLNPAADATVTEATQFSWQGAGPTYVIAIEDLDVFQAIYVVTARQQLELPDLSTLGVYYRTRGAYQWLVESHGQFDSVDDLAGPNGYLDPFSGDFRYPLGPRTGDGRFSRSKAQEFRLTQ